MFLISIAFVVGTTTLIVLSMVDAA